MAEDELSRNKKLANENVFVWIADHLVFPAAATVLVATGLLSLLKLLGLTQLVGLASQALKAPWLDVQGNQAALVVLPFSLAYLSVLANIRGYAQNFYFKLRPQGDDDFALFGGYFCLNGIVLLCSIGMNLVPLVGFLGFIVINGAILVMVILIAKSLTAGDPAKQFLNTEVRSGAMERLAETVGYGLLMIAWNYLYVIEAVGPTREDWFSPAGAKVAAAGEVGIYWMMSLSVAFHVFIKMNRRRVPTLGNRAVLAREAQLNAYYSQQSASKEDDQHGSSTG